MGEKVHRSPGGTSERPVLGVKLLQIGFEAYIFSGFQLFLSAQGALCLSLKSLLHLGAKLARAEVVAPLQAVAHGQTEKWQVLFLHLPQYSG